MIKSDNPRFTDHVVVVTGASRGIGAAIAREFASEGASIVITARSTKDRPHHALSGTLDETAAEIRALGINTLPVPADITLEDGCDRIYRETKTHFGRCDILVNNAGIAYVGPFLESSIKRWDIQFGVNVRGPMMLSRAFLPGMLERKSGRVINISSGAGRMETRQEREAQARSRGPADPDRAKMAAYGAAKAALNRLTIALADECADSGVSFNALDVAAVTQIYALNMQGIDHTTLELPEAPAQIVTWMAAQNAEFSGHLLDQDELLARLRAEGDVRPRVAPMQVPP